MFVITRSQIECGARRFGSGKPKGALAQLGERLLCKQEVTGSIPVGSIIYPSVPLEQWHCSQRGVSEVSILNGGWLVRWRSSGFVGLPTRNAA